MENLWYARNYGGYVSAVLTTAVILLATAISGCSTSKPKDGLTSSLTFQGKGYPNSDAVATYGYLSLEGVSSDSTYGYTMENPIKVAHSGDNGSGQESKYMNALLGPNGENIYFERLGSCCHFEDKTLSLGGGLLDKFYLKIANGTEVVLYLDMYRTGILLAPKGLTYRK